MDRDTLNAPCVEIRLLRLKQDGPLVDQMRDQLRNFCPVVPEVGIPFHPSRRLNTTGYATCGSILGQTAPEVNV